MVIEKVDGVDVTYDKFQLRYAGHWIGNWGGTRAVDANLLYCAPIVIAVPLRFDRIACRVSVAGALATKARMGIYLNKSPVSLAPGALVMDSGEVAVDAVAQLDVIIDYTASKGIIWVAFITNGTPTMYVTTHDWELLGRIALTIDGNQVAMALTYGPLPNPAPAVAFASYKEISTFLRIAA